jgi:hypothetical protein
METITSKISTIEYPINECLLGKLIRPSIFKLIQEEFPSFLEDDYISYKNIFTHKSYDKFIISYLYILDYNIK